MEFSTICHLRWQFLVAIGAIGAIDTIGAIDATGCYGHRLCRRGGLVAEEGGEDGGGGDVGEEDGGFVAEAHAAVEQA